MDLCDKERGLMMGWKEAQILGCNIAEEDAHGAYIFFVLVELTISFIFYKTLSSSINAVKIERLEKYRKATS